MAANASNATAAASAIGKFEHEQKTEQPASPSSVTFKPPTLPKLGPKANPPLERATAEQIAALSPSPFPAALDSLPWLAVNADGSTLLHILDAGDPTQPIQPLNRIYMLARASTAPPAAAAYLERLGDDELDFILGQAQQPRGLEVALCSLCVGCHALLRIRGRDAGFSNTRRPDGVEAADDLHYELRVTRQEKEKNLHQMTADEKLAYCRQRREIGKALFQQGQVRSAYKQYDKARTVLKSMEARVAEGGEERAELEVLMHVNAAACMAKVGDHIAVIELCNTVLAQQPTHPKALYRRATARLARDEHTDAAADLTALLAADPDMAGPLREQVQRQLARCKQQLRKADEGRRERWDGFLLNKERPSLYDDRIKEREAEVEVERRQSQPLLMAVDSVKSWWNTALGLAGWAWQEGWRRCRRHSD